MMEMVHYIEKNPDFIVNGFMKAGILAALNGKFPEEDTVNNDDYKDDEDEYDEEENDEDDNDDKDDDDCHS